MAGKKIFVTGVGIISSIGTNLNESLQAFNSRNSGITRLELIKSRHAAEVSTGEVKLTNDALKVLAGVKDNEYHSRSSLFGIIAVKEALQSSGIKSMNEYRTGIISATTVGGMGITENLWLDYLDESKTGDWLGYIETHESGDCTECIADHFGIKDYLSTVSTACSSSANSIMFGARLIKNGILERVIVGGTDSLSRFTINGFLALEILDPEPCKPFDAERKGLNLGEGAGFLVLESENSLGGKTPICVLSGYGNANDAFHQTASSPEGRGALKAMELAFQSSGLLPADIDYINAHGTGTEINDLSEGMALKQKFGEQLPPFSSTKAFTGHTLGAAGGIEAVFSVLAIQKSFIWPSLNFNESMPELNIVPATVLDKNKRIDHVLSNSFGFGGNSTSLIFSKI